MIEQLIQQDDLLSKLVLKNGHVISLLSDAHTVDEMVSHPKFLKFRDNANDIFVSIEDIVAFEIVTYRKVENDVQAISESPNE